MVVSSATFVAMIEFSDPPDAIVDEKSRVNAGRCDTSVRIFEANRLETTTACCLLRDPSFLSHSSAFISCLHCDSKFPAGWGKGELEIIYNLQHLLFNKGTSMAPLEELLQQVGFHYAKAQPFFPTYIHVLLSALICIYTGAHASLSIPKSAAKPPKKKKQVDDDEEDETSQSFQKMEGLSPSDAIMFPLLAGCTLAGLYFLIKWLEDPALLNKVLNWYFSVFGVLSVAQLFTDAMGIFTSSIFPAKYASDGKIWEIRRKERVAESVANPLEKRNSPLPGLWSKLPLPPVLLDALWTLSELPTRRIHVRAYIHRIVEASLRIGPQGTLSFILALAAVLYYNLGAKPWWLTNILGYSFAYTALQLMSPTTFWTGTLMLSALFFYDIYFVFFTPMMVTVATKIDIPAKLLFPRPADPGADPAKSLAMLGLGDIVLPGIVMGLALRFDLYMFYLRKQRRRVASDGTTASNDSVGPNGNETRSTTDGTENNTANSSTIDTKETASPIIKAPYETAIGSWGERFWVTSPFRSSSPPSPPLGVLFPKPYFHAALFGYTAGMLVTLSIMQIFGHAQPALLYLVPGVLVSLWGMALVRGERKQMWEYDETENEEKGAGKGKDSEEGGKGRGEKTEGKKSIFSWARQDDIAKRLKGVAASEGASKSAESTKGEYKDDKSKSADSKRTAFSRDRKTELVFFSINLPNSTAHDEESKVKAEKRESE